MTAYAELHCKTNYSFLEGASHAEELAATARECGYQALAVTDRDSLAGVVRAHVAAKEAGLKLIVGAELHLSDARLTLDMGDMLIFYTDGFTEAREPAKRQMFGLERLCDVVTEFRADTPLPVCAEHAKAAVDRFTASTELQDDLTLLLLRRIS